MDMLIFTALNALLTLISIIGLGSTEGWDKLKQFPYMALWIYLIFFAFWAFLSMWHRTKEDAEEKEETNRKLKNIEDKVSGIERTNLLLEAIAKHFNIDTNNLGNEELKNGDSKPESK
jgi:Na+/melibiose symporter-like transporter